MKNRGTSRFLILFSTTIWGVAIARAEMDSMSSLVNTSAQRLQLAEKIALAKWDSGAAVEDASREAQVIQRAVNDGTEKGMDAGQVKDFFKAQIEANKLVQYSLLADWRRKGKAPSHTPVDLVKEIRPQLDEIEKQLISELKETSAERSNRTCRADLPKAVGKYLAAYNVNVNSRTAVALERSLAATCIQMGE